MPKRFNTTGVCIPDQHYIVDISSKLEQIWRLVEAGHYLAFNRPHQYGKTTVLFLLSQLLNHKVEYLALRISFEGIDEPTYAKHESFIKAFLDLIRVKLQVLNENKLVEHIEKNIATVQTMRVFARVDCGYFHLIA